MDNTVESPEPRDPQRRRGVFAWLRMLHIVRRTERGAAQHLQQWALSYAQFDVLAQIGSSEGISQQALAERLLVTQGNITQLLDKMERRGLVQRTPEGRTNKLRLTAAGQTLFAEVIPAHEDWLERRFAGLSMAEQHELHRLLAKLDRSLRDQRPSAK